jgi:sterol desaturase/sphingolipid hydroxylase (fatty acid hydroxylase superfamily)
MATSTRGQQYWHALVRCGRCNVRDMEGLAASVLLIAILLGVLLVVGGLVYLLAQRLPKRSPEPPRKPVNRRIGIGSIIVVLLIIGLWAGIKSASASNPHPQPAVQLTCPAGPTWVLLQELCLQL